MHYIIYTVAHVCHTTTLVMVLLVCSGSECLTHGEGGAQYHRT